MPAPFFCADDARDIDATDNVVGARLAANLRTSAPAPSNHFLSGTRHLPHSLSGVVVRRSRVSAAGPISGFA